MKSFFSVLLCLALLPAAVQAQAPGQPPLQQAPVPDNVPGVPMSSTAPSVGGRATPMGTLASLGADYRIGPNDLMDIEVYGVPDLKRTVRVNSSGQISLALVGNVAVSGMSAQRAEAFISEKYAEKYLQNPQVSVFIKEFTSQRITIEGAVAKPGIYPITGEVTLLRALALAGGGGAYADLTEIMLFRVGPEGVKTTQKHNLNKIRAGEVADPAVLADDVLVIRRDPMRTALRDSLFRDVMDSINPFSTTVVPRP